MPLRVTVELIPRGDESRKCKVAVVDIRNDGTGTHEVGNYDMRAEGNIEGGWDDFYHGKVRGVKRGDYLDMAIDCMCVLHTSNEELTLRNGAKRNGGGIE